MVETMRYADPGDCKEMAQAQEAFFTELSKYLSLARSFFTNLLVQHNIQYHRKELLSSFHLNGHTSRVYSKTQKLTTPCTA